MRCAFHFLEHRKRRTKTCTHKEQKREKTQQKRNEIVIASAPFLVDNQRDREKKQRKKLSQ